jgi:hypothetical protein
MWIRIAVPFGGEYSMIQTCCRNSKFRRTLHTDFMDALSTASNEYLALCSKNAQKAEKIFKPDKCKFIAAATTLSSLPKPSLPEVCHN